MLLLTLRYFATGSFQPRYLLCNITFLYLNIDTCDILCNVASFTEVDGDVMNICQQFHELFPKFRH
ncbi:DNA replication initiator [Operophtera brumata]|uniref:DNA replication initiator n=1 Tax=Operophtera brumata TaxID=104452 RepID=A0A0L7LHC1_OPEBR|nr:DNA replication initiator [Operophtera brumata]